MLPEHAAPIREPFMEFLRDPAGKKSLQQIPAIQLEYVVPPFFSCGALELRRIAPQQIGIQSDLAFAAGDDCLDAEALAEDEERLSQLVARRVLRQLGPEHGDDLIATPVSAFTVEREIRKQRQT